MVQGLGRERRRRILDVGYGLRLQRAGLGWSKGLRVEIILTYSLVLRTYLQSWGALVLWVQVFSFPKADLYKASPVSP